MTLFGLAVMKSAKHLTYNIDGDDEMKIEAIVEFSKPLSDCSIGDSIHIDVDTDYVEDNSSSIIEWVRNELESIFGKPFNDEDFTVTNMDEIIDDIKFEEFQDKVN